MKRAGIAGLLILLVVMAVLVYHYDILNLREGKEDIIAQIIEYEDTRRAPDRLEGYLNDSDPEIRARAALAIGRIGEIGPAEKLPALLVDTSVEVASAAAFAIALTGEKRLASQILEFCPDLGPDVLGSALSALGRLTDTSMSDAIGSLAGYLDHPDHRVREQAAYALWRAGAKGNWPRLAELARTDPVKTVRSAALYSLSRLRVAEPVDLYAEMMADSDPFIRINAARGLGYGKDATKTFLAAIGLNDRDNNVVAQAIAALENIGNDRAREYLAARYEEESDEKLKVQLLETFGRLKSDIIAERVNLDIDSLTSPNIRSAGIAYLGKVRKEEALPLIDTLLELNDRRINVGICAALEAIGGEYVKPRLNALFKDSVPEVRGAAFEALGSIDAVNIDYYIKAALDDTDEVLISSAVDKIGTLKLRAYLPRLMAMMKPGENFGTDLKRTVVAAAAEFLKESPDDSLAEDILFHGLQDKDYLVSREAAEVYRTVLAQDKSAYINRPDAFMGKRAVRKFLAQYATNPHAVISTDRGEVEIELYWKETPMAVYNFIELAKDKFYDGLTFHRVVPGFVVQGGDPRGDGSGGPGHSIRCEYREVPFERGTVGMATSGKDSGGSQFFFMLARHPHLDGRYTLFGKVVAGMDVVDKLVRGDRIKTIRIKEERKK